MEPAPPKVQGCKTHGVRAGGGQMWDRLSEAVHWERGHNPLTSDVHSALYLSVPFCRTKCSFCNFASGVFSRDLLDSYVAHLERSIAGAPSLAAECGARFGP